MISKTPSLIMTLSKSVFGTFASNRFGSVDCCSADSAEGDSVGVEEEVGEATGVSPSEAVAVTVVSSSVFVLVVTATGSALTVLVLLRGLSSPAGCGAGAAS